MFQQSLFAASMVMVPKTIPKFLSKLGPNPAKTRPKKTVWPTTLSCGYISALGE